MKKNRPKSKNIVDKRVPHKRTSAFTTNRIRPYGHKEDISDTVTFGPRVAFGTYHKAREKISVGAKKARARIKGQMRYGGITGGKF